eukprot:CAMPEP_0167830970 /NCGR_PEP_ID=MMETSP0112_2-20121227/13307_1 /TAXON_ID=91324 /ORGANISM="Lotharella globosa, Strain CCCM811" /LENGTH=161 /DNA_ID=CAMNT_0007735427 /DNA_START=153 /DNA_END=635 /DNA_ORIENTATION=+
MASPSVLLPGSLKPNAESTVVADVQRVGLNFGRVLRNLRGRTGEVGSGGSRKRFATSGRISASILLADSVSKMKLGGKAPPQSAGTTEAQDLKPTNEDQHESRSFKGPAPVSMFKPLKFTRRPPVQTHTTCIRPTAKRLITCIRPTAKRLITCIRPTAKRL